MNSGRRQKPSKPAMPSDRLPVAIRPDAKSASPKRRGGKAKRGKRGSIQGACEVLRLRRIPAYDLLEEPALARLEAQADWLLETVGMEFRGDAIALELFAGAGAKIDGQRVRFPAGLARHLCSTAPSSFELHGRNPSNTVTLGGEGVVLMPGYGSPFVTDLERGRRYASLEDFQNFVKLTYQTPFLHHSGGTVVEPADVPVSKRHLDMVLAHLTLSDKPFMGGVTSPQRARDSLEMARIVFGRPYLDCHAVMQGNININSPFVFDDTMSGALREYAAANQCVCVSPAIFGGAMGPVTPAAIAAQTLAEAMAGIALAQLVRPGCPVVMGSFHSTMNLRTGSLTFGTPEANLVTMALAQLGRRLKLPVRSGGGQITASNCADGQAMQDSANAMWSALLSGSNQVWHAAGWLEGGLTMSYEKFILDLDNCGALLRLLQGMQVDESSLSRNSYLETEPGETFLSTRHTIEHFSRANYESLLGDAGNFENWRDAGSPTAAERATPIWKRMLEAYRQPAMDPQISTELEAYVAARKAELPDEWY